MANANRQLAGIRRPTGCWRPIRSPCWSACCSISNIRWRRKFAGPKKKIADRIGGVDHAKSPTTPEEFAGLVRKPPDDTSLSGSIGQAGIKHWQIIVDGTTGMRRRCGRGTPTGRGAWSRIKGFPGGDRRRRFPGRLLGKRYGVRRRVGRKRQREYGRGRAFHAGGRSEGCGIAGDGAVVQEEAKAAAKAANA